MGRLDGKVAIVTGGGSGFGQATAILFGKEGAKVVVADISVEGGEGTVKTIKEAGGEAVFVRTDVTKSSDVENMVKTTVDTYGELNVLFACAGLCHNFKTIEECEEEVFDRDIAVNLKGCWLSMKYSIPEMAKAGGGSIVTVSSTCADRGVGNCCAYAAAKGGIASLSRAAAIELCSKNIRVNWVAPGSIWTPSWQRVAKQAPEVWEVFEKQIPMHRAATMEEAAAVVLFFVSDESSYITAQRLAIDGGQEADSRTHL